MFITFTSRQRDQHAFAKSIRPFVRARIASAIALALCVLAAGTGLPAPAAAKSVAVIRNDSGGSIANRLQTIGQYRSQGTRVEIRGQCVSACTMFLGLSDTCVAQSSRLGFHGPQSQYYGISLPPDEFEYWSQVMADHYPGAIRSWFLTEVRQTTMDVITISGSQAIRMGARACD